MEPMYLSQNPIADADRCLLELFEREIVLEHQLITGLDAYMAKADRLRGPLE